MDQKRRSILRVASTGALAGCLSTEITRSVHAQVAQTKRYCTAEIATDDRICSIWAQTKLLVWPEKYVIVSLPKSSLSQATSIVAMATGTFAALVLERDEVSLTLPEPVWTANAVKANAHDGPCRALTFDLSLDLDVFGYFAQAALRLANAKISIVPESAYLKDHILVHERDLDQTVTILNKLIEDCRRALPATQITVPPK